MSLPDRLSRLTPSAELVDWSLFVAVAVLLTTGLATAFAGSLGDAWLFVVHGVAGLSLVVLVGVKLHRVRARVRAGVRARSGRVALSLLLATLVLGALGTGLWFVFGGPLFVGPLALLVIHVLLGLAIVPVLWVHLRDRLHAPTDALAGSDRRDALRYAGLVGAGAVAWRTQKTVNRALGTDSADRRFTGSRERGSGDGNRFPVTMWVADDPDPVDVGAWSLSVEGAVSEPFALESDALPTDGERTALLDCTSGWYSEHDWSGVRVADLLDRAGVDDDARWVQFRSVTGYRWSLPVEEARGALLATAVDGESLSHGHGFPLRLVAPERRGFQWVKWVESVRVTRRRELGEWVAIFVSGLGE
ncbi:molybdopterin-dependent oxidoreductase [Haloglomus litoreum]|uniref:molybdopterin-dependent oxidoreductase n=1 Tax=Haloglomus litoreum TaxID=3034026 RepID=UPI0023E7782E|nr:molybdopterin-dependent oxidoreductase [Haloglomus sp. DT116]